VPDFFISDFNQIWILTDFNSLQYQISQKFVQCKPSWYKQTGI